MGTARESAAGGKFRCTVSERAAFEAGIKMATVYHQFVGTPFSEKNRSELERSIEGCILSQPYVSSAAVRISAGGDKSDQYAYTSLTGDMIDAVVTVSVDGVTVTAEMRYDDALKYPLMYISSVKRPTARHARPHPVRRTPFTTLLI